MEKTDLLIKDVQVYNSVFQKFFEADVYIKQGKIYYQDFKRKGEVEAEKVVDGSGKYMVPGLVDAHMHIESSMLTPQSMAERLADCGVTTIISEPHEIANVNGIEGICDMMKAGENAPIDIFYGIPSCVPSTNSSLETTGGVLDFAKMKSLLYHPKVSCVGEIMNYREVIRENDLEISKLLDYLRENDPAYIIEGHCSSLMDLDLAKFLYLGIDSDHTEHTLEELKQRFMNGMYVEIQSKMLKKEVIDFIDAYNLYGHFGFVTDDVMTDTLMEEGHLDAVVRKAIKLGMTPEKAIYHATYTNANRMNLKDRNMLTPGKRADFILLDDLAEFKIAEVYKSGRRIDKHGGRIDKDGGHIDMHAEEIIKAQRKESDGSSGNFADSYRHMIAVKPVDESSFVLTTDAVKDGTLENGTVEVNVMRVTDGTTQTIREKAVLPVINGEVIWEGGSLCLAVVFERYGKSPLKQGDGIGYGFVTGNCIKRGAVATSFAHDHHNLLAVGGTKGELVNAVNRIIEIQGGICVYEGTEKLAEISLNIGGIMSDASSDEVAADLKNVRNALVKLGYSHYNQIMSLSTLSLLASPALKISDKGMIDVENGRIVDWLAN